MMRGSCCQLSIQRYFFCNQSFGIFEGYCLIKYEMCILITIIANIYINEITSKNNPPTRLNGLLAAQTVLVRLTHNFGSGVVLSCCEFGLV